MPPKKLEQYKYFGVAAWFLCLSFVVFLYMLVLELKKEVVRLQDSSISLEQKMNSVNSK